MIPPTHPCECDLISRSAVLGVIQAMIEASKGRRPAGTPAQLALDMAAAIMVDIQGEILKLPAALTAQPVAPMPRIVGALPVANASTIGPVGKWPLEPLQPCPRTGLGVIEAGSNANGYWWRVVDGTYHAGYRTPAAQPVAQEPVAEVTYLSPKHGLIVDGKTMRIPSVNWLNTDDLKVGSQLYAHPAIPAPDDLAREVMDLREALNPPRSGPDAWCQPMDCGKHTPRVWVIRFEDQDMPDLVFDNEADARLKFTRANRSWNCYLMSSLPLSPATPAPVEAGLRTEIAELKRQLSNMTAAAQDWMAKAERHEAALRAQSAPVGGEVKHPHPHQCLGCGGDARPKKPGAYNHKPGCPLAQIGGAA